MTPRKPFSAFTVGRPPGSCDRIPEVSYEVLTPGRAEAQRRLREERFAPRRLESGREACWWCCRWKASGHYLPGTAFVLEAAGDLAPGTKLFKCDDCDTSPPLPGPEARLTEVP